MTRAAEPDVVIHPACDLPYASYLLEGLGRVVGPSAIRYGTHGFPARFGGGRVLAFYRAGDPEARVFVSLTDQTTVDPAGKAWSRVYAAVNVDDGGGHGTVDDADVVPIGPTFGVRVAPELVRRHLAHLWRWSGRRHVRAATRHSRLALRHQRRRARIERYVPGTSDPDYVFYAAWPWAKHPEVNPPRARFVEACLRAPGLRFEGGFAPRRRRDVPEVLPLSARSRYPIDDYLARIARSAVAFNNPAVHGCLGWKLGEFLALGKAIVSLPLGRALPAPLEHGVHLHLVDGSPASLDDALERIRRDHDYRRHLEHNARQWYERHLAPEVVARKLLQMARP